jgi:DNA-directed RNA polymerase II subunit RPB2
VASDRNIVQCACYDPDDDEMMDRFRVGVVRRPPSSRATCGVRRQASLEEGREIMDQEDALDFLGKRGTLEGGTRRERIDYARDLLAREVLPHIGTSLESESKKAYFLGYMVNRLLQLSLGRVREDDRDHFANKRADLAGPLLAQLFKALLSRLRTNVMKCAGSVRREGRQS